MSKTIIIGGIPVYVGSEAERAAIAFQKYLSDNGLKSVYYRTGRCGNGYYTPWSLDVYIIPMDMEKPHFQRSLQNIGQHIISLRSGYYVSTRNNAIMSAISEYMDQ